MQTIKLSIDNNYHIDGELDMDDYINYRKEIDRELSKVKVKLNEICKKYHLIMIS